MNPTAGIVTSVAAGVVLAGVINVVRTIRMISSGSPNVIRSGPWSTRLTDGGGRMTLHQRAVVALTGLWAMRSSEAVYFTALHDSSGERLNARHSYEISGQKLPGRWWSITVYRNYQFIPNRWNRHSRSITTTQFKTDGRWVISLSNEPSSGNWIPLGNRSGLISISLRIYSPDLTTLSMTDGLQLPAITRLPPDSIPGRVVPGHAASPDDRSGDDHV